MFGWNQKFQIALVYLCCRPVYGFDRLLHWRLYRFLCKYFELWTNRKCIHGHAYVSNESVRKDVSFIFIIFFFFFFVTLEDCFLPLTLLSFRPCPLSLFRTLCAESRTFLRTTSRNFASGSVLSVIMFCPEASASEPTVLATCRRKGLTNESHRPLRILPIPWPSWMKVGLLYIGLSRYHRDRAPLDVNSTVPIDP